MLLSHRPALFVLCAAIAVLPARLIGAEYPSAEPDQSVRAVVVQAGNAEDEKERFRLLQQLAQRGDLDAAVRQDLQGLLPVLDFWANETYRPAEPRRRAAENGYLCGFFVGQTGLDKYLMPRIDPASPLYGIWCLYRGRILIHHVIQSGNLRGSRELREAWCGEGRRLLGLASEAFPENRVIRMYLDQPMRGWPDEATADEQAPQWANLQRESIQKLAQIVHWWIDHRQLENGEFGGGWGDDCEMWRWWSAAMIAFDDPKITAAQQRFAASMFGQPHMTGGYTSHMSDVEHTAEDSKDTITPMLHLCPDDPQWGQRALRIADLMENVWTGTNAHGTRQFKGTYFNVDGVHPSPQRACDTVWHPGVMQPVMLYWMRTREPRLTRLFCSWMDTWVDVSARDDRGKPAGIMPSAIHWPDGLPGGQDEPWYLPNIDRQAHLYDWPGNMTMLTSTLLLTYHITGDERYLEPIHSMARLRRVYLEGSRGERGEPGSEAWCAAQLGFLAESLAKYRALTLDQQYDDMLRRDADGYVRFRIDGTRQALTRDLERQAEALRSNWPGYTSEVRWTDRVLAFTGNYLNDYARPALPRVNPALLYASATGDLGRIDYLPLNAVRWLTPPRDIAALVSSTGTDRLQAELYHFGDAPRPMGAEFYLLRPGTYRVTLRQGDQTLWQQNLEVSGPRAQVQFELPARQLCQLSVDR